MRSVIALQEPLLEIHKVIVLESHSWPKAGLMTLPSSSRSFSPEHCTSESDLPIVQAVHRLPECLIIAMKWSVCTSSHHTAQHGISNMQNHMRYARSFSCCPGYAPDSATFFRHLRILQAPTGVDPTWLVVSLPLITTKTHALPAQGMPQELLLISGISNSCMPLYRPLLACFAAGFSSCLVSSR